MGQWRSWPAAGLTPMWDGAQPCGLRSRSDRRAQRAEVELKHCGKRRRAALEAAAKGGAFPAVDKELGELSGVAIGLDGADRFCGVEADLQPVSDRGEAPFDLLAEGIAEIGRASCRERVSPYV